MKINKLLICCRSDSFIKASIPVCNIFEHNSYRVEYLILTDNGVVDKEHLNDIGFSHHYISSDVKKIYDMNFISQFDAVMLSLKGNEINRILSRLSDVYPADVQRPVFFGGYCGIVYEKFSMGLLFRQPLDIFFVNSKYDYELFCKLLSDYKVSDSSNITLTGLPLLDLSFKQNNPSPHDNKKNVLFAGQPTVPETLSERASLVYSLFKYCEKYPERTVYFKPRHRLNQDSVHKTVFHYQKIVECLSRKHEIPQNFMLTYDPIVDLLDMVDLCLTVSSTAAFEAVNKGVHVGFLMDFGIREDYGTNYFAASGCAMTFTDLLDDRMVEPDRSWWDNHFLSDGKNSFRVFQEVDSLVNDVSGEARTFPFRYNHLKAITKSYCDFIEQDLSLGYKSIVKNFLLKVYYFLKIKGFIE
ncbi:hypothetical protein HTZ97_05450 [Desulfuromonas acetoxidans]|uniref:DUF6716 putative glycosyltransferase n=1 Tax=Desulfuromonas acetoxidans TaxID=891 RepID=UPI000306B138|nr:DUF6716 putative glycosyltransferase [Desulfuromonas acetoxidans]MBF0644771.1 hypothetical protein [Desulfuromonas acetoxidans]NVD23711.1 hypothetical protein [Desulfuromonas acetoxidans]NVE15904.1 hypothetical protein [Desulfuromonas acetoxidans]